MLESDHEARLKRARLSLEGLSVGDALGGFFEFNHRMLASYVAERRLMSAPWRYTDDTNMALSIYECLRLHERIDQDVLARSFADHFQATRGYGAGARRLVNQLREGADWREVAPNMFAGSGSYGNGGAMRVTPLGAYFADDLAQVAAQAALSAEITHAHTEGIAGTIAAAVAAAVVCRHETLTIADLIEAVLPHVPDSEVKNKLRRAQSIQPTTDIQHVAAMLGNGSGVSAQDTVPFCVWSAGRHQDDFENAFWQTASVGGDVDTTCAIVCGIVACRVGWSGIPAEWVKRREPLPTWALGEDDTALTQNL
jgi:ADP-ribosylglycohydrolase